MIGIAGGVGPYAGPALLRKIFDHTQARSDQDHVDSVLLSLPSSIPDRTGFLLGHAGENPGTALGGAIRRLGEAGATVAGIPCNTAHAPAIFNEITAELKRTGTRMRLVHMVKETVDFIRTGHPDLKRIGVLSTTGTWHSAVYRNALEAAGLETIRPPPDMQEELIHPAVYHPAYGIKSVTGRVTVQSRENLKRGLHYLKEKGAEAVILGCTEIPLAYPGRIAEGLPAIDPAVALARALLREAYPGKLRPLR